MPSIPMSMFLFEESSLNQWVSVFPLELNPNDDFNHTKVLPTVGLSNSLSLSFPSKPVLFSYWSYLTMIRLIWFFDDLTVSIDSIQMYSFRLFLSKDIREHFKWDEYKKEIWSNILKFSCSFKFSLSVFHNLFAVEKQVICG